MLALSQVSIRGDFRTTVEYLIKLLETDEFISNDISTVWLDLLIAERVQVFRHSVELLCSLLKDHDYCRVRDQTLWLLLCLHHCMSLIQLFTDISASTSSL